MKCVESGQACDKYKESCNVDMDGDVDSLNVQALSYAGLKTTTWCPLAKTLRARKKP